MPKTYKISEEEARELREKMKKSKAGAVAYRRMEAVALRGEGKSNEEIAEITKLHPGYVSKLVSIYRNEGIGKISEDGRKGGNNRRMTMEEEEKMLSEFTEAAKTGQIITPAEIKKAYDEKRGKETHKTQIYRVLKRHNWRGVMPRSRHPKKASEEVMEASKKLTNVQARAMIM